MRELSRVALVVFDCDSTLTAIEGIDELGQDRRSEIEALTDAAMRGELPLEAVYGKRLDLIQPTRDRVRRLGEQYVQHLVPDARAAVSALHECGVAVRIMSGGLRPAVLRVAAELNVAEDDVAAVEIHFDDAGSYAGYDAASPLARSGGKRELLRKWRAERPGRVMMVGDGATDLESADTADVFVAYAGVVAREAVLRGADVVIRADSLAAVVPVALGGAAPHFAAARDIFMRGLALLDAEAVEHLPNLNR